MRAGLAAPTDPEPEYVSINSRNQLAVTLQENNGVALVDLPSGRITTVFSAGTATINGIDTRKDGVIDLTGSITDVPREPDAVAWVDDRYLATANEGDWHGGTRAGPFSTAAADASSGTPATPSSGSPSPTGCTTRTGPPRRAPSRRAWPSPSTTACGTRSSARSGATSSPSTTWATPPGRSSGRSCRPPTARRGSCRSRRVGCSRSPARRTTPRSTFGPRCRSSSSARARRRSRASSPTPTGPAPRSVGVRSAH
ncbi:hypothetical protein NKG94_32760 [Micromonospora sp. M12]